MGDTSNPSGDDIARLEGSAGDAVARGVMEESSKRRQYLREAVQQLDSAEGQPAEELVRDVAGVVAAANTILHGTSWDEAARDEYGEWQAMEGPELDHGALVRAADRVRQAGETMLAAADDAMARNPTTPIDEWADGPGALEHVVAEAAAARGELSGGSTGASSRTDGDSG